MLLSGGISRKNGDVLVIVNHSELAVLPLLPVHPTTGVYKPKISPTCPQAQIRRQPVACNWRQLYNLSFLVLAASSGTF
jgi:hypothetical protein